MVHLVAWGNNAGGNLSDQDDQGDSLFLHTPTIIRQDEAFQELVWASWSCTIAKDRAGDHVAWGETGFEDEEKALELLDENEYAKIVGHEQPIAILTSDGDVQPFDVSQPTRKGIKDVAVMGLGPVYALLDRDIVRYPSLVDFLNDADGTTVDHPAFDFKHPTSLYATESRVMLFSRGPLPHVFEMTEDPKGAVTVALVEELEGLGVKSVIAGSANRFVVLTEAGDAFLIAKGTVEVELLEIDDASPVRLVGVGSKFEILVTERNVWVRGSNKFSQLGLAEGHPSLDDDLMRSLDDGFVKQSYFEDPGRISSLRCGRWSTIAVMQDT